MRISWLMLAREFAFEAAGLLGFLEQSLDLTVLLFDAQFLLFGACFGSRQFPGPIHYGPFEVDPFGFQPS